MVRDIHRLLEPPGKAICATLDGATLFGVNQEEIHLGVARLIV
jgi:hypothetical protein